MGSQGGCCGGGDKDKEQKPVKMGDNKTAQPTGAKPEQSKNDPKKGGCCG